MTNGKTKLSPNRAYILGLSLLLIAQLARFLQTTRQYDPGHFDTNLSFEQRNSTVATPPSFGIHHRMRIDEMNVTTEEASVDGVISIFYNVFLPKNNIHDALSIVQSQLDARKNSPTLSNSTLYYTQIGQLDGVMFPSCNPCTRLNAVEEGGEVLTLQKLYEHCGKNPLGRVIYLHNKGSYHPTIKNKWLRKILTNAVFSDECVHMPRYDYNNDGNESAIRDGKNDGSAICDICAANFVVVPSPHAPGNMFLAECSYVNKLIPPIDYQDAREAMMNELWNKPKEELDQMGFATESKLHEDQFNKTSWVGTERFAMEHWAFSHPSVRPCDTSAKGFNYINPRNPLGYDAPKREMAPRQNFTDFHLSVHPFFRLEGLLYRYMKLYGAIPSNYSWAYTFFE